MINPPHTLFYENNKIKYYSKQLRRKPFLGNTRQDWGKLDCESHQRGGVTSSSGTARYSHAEIIIHTYQHF